jgi:hypothetical protein
VSPSDVRRSGLKDLGQCLRHANALALFECRACRDRLCHQCRAAGENDLCVLCAEFSLADAAHQARVRSGEPLEADAPKRARTGRYLIVALVLLNALTFAFSLLAGRSDLGGPADRTKRALSVIERAVEASRDPSGHVPDGLEALLPVLPEEVAGLVRSGDIAYQPSLDRKRYELLVVLRVSASNQAASGSPR